MSPGDANLIMLDQLMRHTVQVGLSALIMGAVFAVYGYAVLRLIFRGKRQ